MIRLLVYALIIYAIVKALKKHRSPHSKARVGRRDCRREVGGRDRITSLRNRFNRILDYFDPRNEREPLTFKFHELMNGEGRREPDFEKTVNAMEHIVSERERDVKRIRSMDQLERRYSASKDTFTDGLRNEIESLFDRCRDILDTKHFAAAIDELKVAMRYLAYLVSQGEEGRDNSIRWADERDEQLQSIRRKVREERRLWVLI